MIKFCSSIQPSSKRAEKPLSLEKIISQLYLVIDLQINKYKVAKGPQRLKIEKQKKLSQSLYKNLNLETSG